MLTIEKGGHVGIGKADPAVNMDIAGEIHANSIFEPADGRLKENISPISNSLDKVLRLRGVTYNWKVGNFPEMQFSADPVVGFIAQDVEPILPEVVSQMSNGRYVIDYGRVVPVLVEALKELHYNADQVQAEVDQVNAEIAAQRQLINELMMGP